MDNDLDLIKRRELSQKKLSRLKEALLIETDTLQKFKLEAQIEEADTNLEEIEDEMRCKEWSQDNELLKLFFFYICNKYGEESFICSSEIQRTDLAAYYKNMKKKNLASPCVNISISRFTSSIRSLVDKEVIVEINRRIYKINCASFLI